MPDRPDECYDAVILEGGAGRRLGGVDKPGLPVGGRSLVGWAAAAVPGARRLILVGPERPELPAAIVVREQPAGAGPVAALRAGLVMVTSPWTVLLAADLPFLRAGHVDRLLHAVQDEACEAPGVVGEDAGGRSQWLLGAWYTSALRAALECYEGFSLSGVMEPMRPGRVRLPEASRDCDTPEDLDRAVTALEGLIVLEEWTKAACEELGITASEVDRDLILDLARDVAHGVARPAAPLTAYLLGLAVGRGEPARDAAARITALADGWPQERPAAE